MRILVTGGAGFLGRHVAESLLAAGHEVLVFDQAPAMGLDTVQGDLCDIEAVRGAMTDVQAVCHLGAVGDVYLAFDQPVLAATVNVAGTAVVMEAARQSGVRKVVYASTWEVYGEPQYTPIDEDHPTNPDHPYNITKLGGEQMVMAYDRLKDVPTLCLRLGTAYGTRMRPNAVIPHFINRASREEPITINGSGEQTRQFTYASDIGRAFVLALASDIRAETFNIVGDEVVSIRQVAEMVARRLPTALTFGEPRLGDVPSAPVSNRKARELLGWEPLISFKSGLDAVIDWQLQRARSELPVPG